MSAHDRHLAGYSKTAVHVTCQKCSNDFTADAIEEYGAAWLEPEECPKCGASGEHALSVEGLDARDIEELKYESRGEDF